jgi:hypothetical protein
LNRTKQLAFLIGISGVPPIAFAAFYSIEVAWVLAILWLVLGGIWYGLRQRCPRCRSYLGNVVQSLNFLAIPLRIQQCPFCGVHFDEPLKIETET